MFARSNAALRPSAIDDALQLIPAACVLSSRKRTWNGVNAMHIRHTLSAFEAPAFTSHVVTLHLGSPLQLVGKVAGHTYRKRMTKGAISIVPAGVASEWRMSGQTEFENLYLYLKPAFLAQVAAETDVNPNHLEIVNTLGEHDAQVKYIGLSLLAELNSDNLAGSLYAESLANLLAIQLLRRYSVARRIVSKFKGGLPLHKLRRACDFINDNLANGLSLHAIAAELNMSVYHFARLFKQETGQTPNEYVTLRRIERAKSLLRETDLPITEICSRVGFESQSHLTTLFRRFTGETPGAYRQNVPEISQARLHAVK